MSMPARRWCCHSQQYWIYRNRQVRWNIFYIYDLCSLLLKSRYHFILIFLIFQWLSWWLKWWVGLNYHKIANIFRKFSKDIRFINLFHSQSSSDEDFNEVQQNEQRTSDEPMPELQDGEDESIETRSMAIRRTLSLKIVQFDNYQFDNNFLCLIKIFVFVAYR